MHSYDHILSTPLANTTDPVPDCGRASIEVLHTGGWMGVATLTKRGFNMTCGGGFETLYIENTH